DREYILAGEPAPHAVLVGVHDDRVVVVDEERTQRRVDVVLGEMPADIVDGERASALGQQIRPLQPRGCLGKRVAGSEDNAAALAQLAEPWRPGDRRANAAGAG